MPYTAYNSVAKMGLEASGAAVKEQYIPLWVYSSGTVGTGSYIKKGSTATSGIFDNYCKLYAVNANWSPSQKFAFEVSFYAPSGTATVQLYNGYNATAISGASVSTTANNSTVVRSATFSLASVPSVGILLTNAYLTKAHLVAIN